LPVPAKIVSVRSSPLLGATARILRRNKPSKPQSRGKVLMSSTTCNSGRLYPTKLAVLFLIAVGSTGDLQAQELTVADFKFDGPLGCAGATIEQLGTNHFKISLGANAPEVWEQPVPMGVWPNLLAFEIVRNARGNTLRIDTEHLTGGGGATEYAQSCSHDAENWTPIQWSGTTLNFPEFTEDTVFVGPQAPMSFEYIEKRMREWEKLPYFKTVNLGKSLMGRNLYRFEITNDQSPFPRKDRWVHYGANQHAGEGYAKWRMLGMMEWLLSEEGADARDRIISHFILMMAPDGPSQGWMRINAQGVDANRSYYPEGNGIDDHQNHFPEMFIPQPHNNQPHEAYIFQKDFEAMMASDSPVTCILSHHTWGGVVDPILIEDGGPEIGTSVGTWDDFKVIVDKYDVDNLVNTPWTRRVGRNKHELWTEGPYLQFGITAILVEGSKDLLTVGQNLKSGGVLMKSLAEFYAGTRGTSGD